MKQLLLLALFSLTSAALFAQKKMDCNQLAIKFHGIIDNEGEDADQLFFEVSNQLYTGTLYNYPGFILLNEQGDTIAKKAVKYYGIGLSFQTHLLDLRADFALPFKGELKLFGSYYKHFYCTFPIEIEQADFVSLAAIQEEALKVGTNFAKDHIILDLGGPYSNEEELKYHFNITNEKGEVKYASELAMDVTAIPIESVGGAGLYLVSVWDAVKQKLLPTKQIKME